MTLQLRRLSILVLVLLVVPIIAVAASTEIDGPFPVVTPQMTSGTALGAAYINPTAI